MKKNRYKDLEDLLYIGFIPYKTRIGNLDFVFKSVSDLEYQKTSLMSGIKDDFFYNSKFHRNYLYHSIFMINGTNVLEKREFYYNDLIDIFKESPSFLINKIFNILDKLATRLNKCINLVEPYAYENNSRYSWLSKRNSILNSYQHTGIKGTEELGLNQFQKYWSVLNIREDEKESFEERYSLAKFLASFTDPKSIRKIDGQDKAKKEEEEKKRERIKLYGTEEEKLKYLDPTSTRDGIIAELEKQMRGDKDAHDKAIEEHEKKLRANMLKQMQELKNMQESRKKENIFIDEARPISKEEMLERINKNKKSPKVFLKSIDENESKYMEMSNVKTEDILEESGLTTEGYNHLVNNEMFKDKYKKIEDREDNTTQKYLEEQKRLAAYAGIDDEETNFDFPNLRNR